MRQSAALALALAAIVTTPVALGTMKTIEFPEVLLTLDDGGGGGGGGGASVRKVLLDFGTARTDGLNTSHEPAVRSAAVDIQAATRANVTNITESLRTATTISELVHRVYDHGVARRIPWAGERTNQSTAHSLGGLAEATIALHREMGKPLTDAQELQVRQDVALMNPEAAKAAAILVFAAIDAEHYRRAAVRNLDHASWQRVQGDLDALTMYHRRVSTQTIDGQTRHVFDEETTRTIEAAINVTNSIGPDGLAAFYQSLDVVGQAIDEVRTTAITPATLREEEDTGPGLNHCVEPGHTLVYSSPYCLVVVGGLSNARYRLVEEDGYSNVVLIDFGGSDEYVHRAGGGYSIVQVNVDLGSGNDIYDAGILAPGGEKDVWGPRQGSGFYQGVGVLYDDGGNDRYRVLSTQGAIGQGAAVLGAGMLLDRSGNDLYEVIQEGADLAHGQAVAMSSGVAILRDMGGDDTYRFTIQPGTNGVPPDGGGAQSFSSLASTAVLLDYGVGLDTYRAGQDEVQAAATKFSFALLHDDGGVNAFEVRSSLGCPTIFGASCVTLPVSEYEPVAGWSQGYAAANATAILLTGGSADTFRYLPYGSSSTEHEGKSLLGAAQAHALAVHYNTGGDDKYDARTESFGTAKSGMSVFIDGGGWDAYLCASVTCYGDGSSLGIGVYYDGISSGDTYADGNNRLIPWARGELGLGVRVSP